MKKAKDRINLTNNNFGNIFRVQKSFLQVKLEKNGCFFRSQSEGLSKHEPDINKECFCGRPNKNSEIIIDRIIKNFNTKFIESLKDSLITKTYIDDQGNLKIDVIDHKDFYK